MTREATGETSGGQGLSPRPDGGLGRGRREGSGEGAADGRPDSVPVPASGRHVQDGAAEGDGLADNGAVPPGEMAMWQFSRGACGPGFNNIGQLNI